MNIQPLSSVTPDELYEVFSEAFAGYERTWTQRELSDMLARRGYNAELSFGAFADGKLVSFTLNGIGGYQGIVTAYDAGTGTIPAFRGQGLSTAIFEHSETVLKAHGIQQYVLEVIVKNAPAISVYQKLGFKTVRELNYFVGERLSIQNTGTSPNIAIRETQLDSVRSYLSFHDFHPTWQNSIESISRQPHYFKAITAVEDGNVVGYGVVEPTSGDIPHLAVHTSHRRKGTGTAILQALANLITCATVKVINADVSCIALTQLLERNGIPVKGQQYEMVKVL